MKNKRNHIIPPENSFAGISVCTDIKRLDADIAILGYQYVSPYPGNLPPESDETAADAVRRQSGVFADHLHNYDFNFGDTLLGDKDIKIADCGDVNRIQADTEQKPEDIARAVSAILNRGSIPITVGTDEGGSISVLRGFKDFGPLCAVHLDAHIDWIDERGGVRDGYSSAMRRASEMEWVNSMAQIGLRGIGSAKYNEVEAARSFGSKFIRSREIHEEGIAACLKRVPKADRYFITIDFDVLEIAIAPGVAFTCPGGLTFDETSDIVRGLAEQGQIAGINISGVRPWLDVRGLTSSTAAHLIINFIGTLVHTGQVG